MIPIIPHFANECLRILNTKKTSNWPSYDEKYLKEENINIVVQINGKKRGLINTTKDISETNLVDMILKDQQLKKHIQGKKIVKKIYVPNKIINIII